jgi:hypothetical protein
MSPTARSLLELRKRGCIADVVERRLAKTFVTKDLFGIIDVLALEPGVKGCLGVQATTVSNQAARVKKILDEPRALMWLGTGNRLEVHGWSKRGARGKRKTWELSVTPITEDLWVRA